MKKYLTQKVDTEDPELVSVIDDLPLWSAPFGLKLLDIIPVRRDMRVLDVGCGTGFPLIEISQRLGESGRIYGIDPWKVALDRVRLKMKIYQIDNIELIEGVAEEIPMPDNFFDLIVSNNGLNNVEDVERSLSECYRVCRHGASMVLTMNLEQTMLDFYDAFEKVLQELGLTAEIRKMKEHIFSKRKPLDLTITFLKNSGFSVNKILQDSFRIRFADGTAMFNHYLIRFWFLDGWKKVVPEKGREAIFSLVEERINTAAAEAGEFSLDIPYVTIDCRKA
jgi:arsenite methyltransferase